MFRNPQHQIRGYIGRCGLCEPHHVRTRPEKDARKRNEAWGPPTAEAGARRDTRLRSHYNTQYAGKTGKLGWSGAAVSAWLLALALSGGRLEEEEARMWREGFTR